MTSGHSKYHRVALDSVHLPCATHNHRKFVDRSDIVPFTRAELNKSLMKISDSSNTHIVVSIEENDAEKQYANKKSVSSGI